MKAVRRGHESDGGDDRAHLLKTAFPVNDFDSGEGSTHLAWAVHQSLQSLAFLCIGIGIPGHDATGQDTFYNAFFIKKCTVQSLFEYSTFRASQCENLKLLTFFTANLSK